MNCPTCGKDNNADGSFCAYCGASLSASISTNTGVSSAELPMVGFGTSVKLGFQRYFEFKGRSTRAEYWWWYLFDIVASSFLAFIDAFLGALGFLEGIFALAVVIPTISLGVRRLHDINRTGWWQLMWLGVFLIAPMVVLIVWLIKQGDKGPNKYGPDPRQATSQ